jgi:hypothetical protein
MEYERILTEEDFARIRELRHKKMVGELMRKHGLKSSSKRDRYLAAAQDEADEAIDKQVSCIPPLLRMDSELQRKVLTEQASEQVHDCLHYIQVHSNFYKRENACKREILRSDSFLWQIVQRRVGLSCKRNKFFLHIFSCISFSVFFSAYQSST